MINLSDSTPDFIGQVYPNNKDFWGRKDSFKFEIYLIGKPTNKDSQIGFILIDKKNVGSVTYTSRGKESTFVVDGNIFSFSGDLKNHTKGRYTIYHGRNKFYPENPARIKKVFR